ncbi:MAG TPA: hypothetical protein VN649_17950 [Ramlibacter sp.]|nr:hypothetical protein [Ramlibacter sp.]
MQTLLSVFENRRAAQRAVDKLLEKGFEPEDVHLQEGAAAANSATASGAADVTASHDAGPERGVLSSIGCFFASLFEQHPASDNPDRYSQAVRRGHSVVVVDVRDEEEADRAYTLLHELGAIDIDERAAKWQSGTASAGASANAGVIMWGTSQSIGPEPMYREGVRVVERSGKPLRDLVARQDQPPPGERAAMMNRPAGSEGEVRVIERTERERAVAANEPRAKLPRDNDSEPREPKK